VSRNRNLRLSYLSEAFALLAQAHDFYPEEPEWLIGDTFHQLCKVDSLAEDLNDDRRRLVRLLWRQRRLNRRLRLLVGALEDHDV